MQSTARIARVGLVVQHELHRKYSRDTWYLCAVACLDTSAGTDTGRQRGWDAAADTDAPSASLVWAVACPCAEGSIVEPGIEV